MTKKKEEEKEIIELELGTSGLVAWIDKEDEELVGWVWVEKKAGHPPFVHYYAVNRTNIAGRSHDYFLHNVVWERMIGEHLPRGFLVDHINGDKLDNRRSNLRLATRSDNEANKRKRRTQAGGKTTSQYKGVNVIKGRNKKYRSTITTAGRQIALGTYYTEREAGEAYNKAAIKYYGEFAYINKFPEEKDDD